MSATNLKYQDVYFDSDEEVFFAMWLQELRKLGYVQSWYKVKEAISITSGYKFRFVKRTQLKTKVKEETPDFTLLRPSEYTPDFEIIWSPLGIKKFLFQLTENAQYGEKRMAAGGFLTDPRKALFFSTAYTQTHVEIKPSFDQQNMERLFVLNQKFIFDKYKLFVNLIEPIELFKKTFLPLDAAPYFKYRKSPTGKNKGIKQVGDWKMDWQPKTINEYLCL